MSYNLFTVHRLQPSVIASALASVLRVTLASVDVADADGDQESRDWGALVLCSYSDVFGDVSLALDIYVQDTVGHRPPESELALKFAAQARTTVFYPAQEFIPSAYWLATPDGLVTRARLEASDDQPPAYIVDAVEAPVPQLPHAQVMQLPEILREQKVPTPTTEEFLAAARAIRRSQGDQAAPELGDEPGTALDKARTALLLWERLVRRMESGWEPSGRYPAEMYVDDLLMRDKLAQREAQAPEVVRVFLRQSIEKLDAIFVKHTLEDGGRALEAAREGSTAVVSGRGWWWLRRPKQLPWGNAT
jgi:hypothetical protein